MNFRSFYQPIRDKVIINNRFSIKFLSKIFSIHDLIKIIYYKFSNAEYFEFKGKILKYFYHSYNNHRITERAIEIPIIRYYFERIGKRTCLEIGNVTNHYYSYFLDLIDLKTVIDKYEKGYGVINKDIKDFFPENKFDFIFSISTFEHMDSDRGRNLNNIKGNSKLSSYAADNIFHICNNILNSKGLFIITAPVGFAHEWDNLLFYNKILDKEFLKVESLKVYFFRRIKEIEWKETDINDAKKAVYNYPLRSVNVLSIVEIIK
jgi:hypothetical protein